MALDDFAVETGLDPELHQRIKKFMLMNHKELFSRVDIEAMFMDLPPTLKEELFFFQFGNLVNKLNFFTEIQEQELKWAIVKQLNKISYERGDKVYNDQELSETIYFI